MTPFNGNIYLYDIMSNNKNKLEQCTGEPTIIDFLFIYLLKKWYISTFSPNKFTHCPWDISEIPWADNFYQVDKL